MLRRLAREISDRMGAFVLTLGLEEECRAVRRARAWPRRRRVPLRARALRPAPAGRVIALGANPRLMARLTGADPDAVRAIARTASSPVELPRPPSCSPSWPASSDSRRLQRLPGGCRARDAIVIPRRSPRAQRCFTRPRASEPGRGRPLAAWPARPSSSCMRSRSTRACGTASDRLSRAPASGWSPRICREPSSSSDSRPGQIALGLVEGSLVRSALPWAATWLSSCGAEPGSASRPWLSSTPARLRIRPEQREARDDSIWLLGEAGREAWEELAPRLFAPAPTRLWWRRRALARTAHHGPRHRSGDDQGPRRLAPDAADPRRAGARGRREEGPPDASERLQAMVAVLPNARFSRIADAGHLAPLERPEVVAGLLVDFLEEVLR